MRCFMMCCPMSWQRMRKKEAKEKGSEYDPLKDEDIFLQQRDFDMYCEHRDGSLFHAN